ncbi:recombinase RecF [Neopusillimonas aromaticivorans]|uniref:recombinase RecF n=1 Tax=Neopusillimonas aromaticivorans TaxID=2979868 RepID=UPI0025920C91|nr:recombinase RecF [Neopusillimonas aromaticivorans]WJJ94037.1 recombinase RecF [Neopusillimonas aromaticivorans]
MHDGEKVGRVDIEFDGGAAGFLAPKGEMMLRHSFTMDAWEPIEAALPYCLDPALFGRASADERRQLLFTVTGASAKTSDIVEAMKQRGLVEDVINAVTPMLRSGFPAAAKYAEERCRDAKAAWKAVTSETYGHKKAEDWAATAPEVDIAELEQMATQAEALKSKLGTEQQRLGAAEQRWKAWTAYQQQAEADAKVFAKLESLEKKLDHDQSDLLKWQDKVKVLEGMAGTGPRVGLVHDLAACLDDVYNEGDNSFTIPADLDARILAAFRQYEAAHGPLDAQADPDAAAQLPEAIRARDLMQSAVNNTRRDIDAAKAAGARMGQAPEQVTEEAVGEIQAIISTHNRELADVTARLDRLRQTQQAAKLAEQNTAKAREHHATAQAWQTAIDALSPDGIPAEILRRAIGPVNRELARCSQAFGWGQVVIDGEMGIYAKDRAYALLSESERWRADVCLALVLADLSGARLVAIDRMDVLETRARGGFIDALDIRAEEGKFDTALVFGTLKALPDLSAYPQTTAHWVDAGALTTTQHEAVAD